MIICTCGAKFEGESMFGDALAHWHAEWSREFDQKIAKVTRVRRTVEERMEMRKAYSKEYYIKNREQIRHYANEYYRRNKKSWARYYAKYRAKRQAAMGVAA